MWFTRISVKYPVFTIMMMLSLMVLGLASWKRMTVEEFPNIDFPFVVVTTQYAGASPEAVESDITKNLKIKSIQFQELNRLLHAQVKAFQW